MRRVFSIMFMLALVFVLFSINVSAAESSQIFDTYIYGNGTETGNGDPIEIPAAFTLQAVLSGHHLGVGNLSDISDLFCDGNSFYLCDSGNNRVLVLDLNLKIQSILSNFQNNGSKDAFNNPTGVFSNGEQLVICDSGNQRILVFSVKNLMLQRVLEKPDISILRDSSGEYIYSPQKAVIDHAGRFYVIAANINQGVIRLDENGKFISFIGAPTVVPKVTELLWRKFATKAQKSRLQQYVPTEYVSLLIDEDGFLYATSKTSANNALVRLNSSGTNILPDIRYFGDSSQATYEENAAPYFADVAVDETGNCYVLDSNQGKIYTYDAEGQLLYAFGTNAFQKGAFYSASAIEYYGDHLYVTDQNKGTVTVFSMTPFAKVIKQANAFYRQGKNEQAREAFMKVRSYCSDYLPAIVAVSSIDLQSGKTIDALAQMKQIRDRENYNKLFERVRNAFIRNYFVYVLIGLALVIGAVLIARKILKKSSRLSVVWESRLYNEYCYSRYTMFHPFDGFWDLKHEKKGGMPAALLILGLFTLCYGVRAQFSGYIVTGTISSEINMVFECAMILLPILFWIIANWCFTTLMDGKGTLKDIFVYTCYSLKPYIVFSLPLFLLSHVLTAEEAMFYTVFNSVSIIWTLALFFFGMITIHDYSLSKGVVATLLTVIGICLIIFILLLLISVTQNITEFFFNLYKEISLRAYR